MLTKKPGAFQLHELALTFSLARLAPLRLTKGLCLEWLRLEGPQIVRLVSQSMAPFRPPTTTSAKELVSGQTHIARLKSGPKPSAGHGFVEKGLHKKEYLIPSPFSFEPSCASLMSHTFIECVLQAKVLLLRESLVSISPNLTRLHLPCT